MKYLLSLALALTLCLAGQARAQEGSDEEDDLPYQGRINWNVKAFEDNGTNLELIRRSVRGNKVVWLVKVKSAEEAYRFRSPVVEYYHAVCYDRDGLIVGSVRIPANTTDVQAGDRIRLTLEMPKGAVLRKTRSIVIRIR